jgi:hypothetical protein
MRVVGSLCLVLLSGHCDFSRGGGSFEKKTAYVASVGALKMVVFVCLRGVRPLRNLSLWQLFVGCMGVVVRWLGLGV